jgi:hypothetical protein
MRWRRKLGTALHSGCGKLTEIGTEDAERKFRNGLTATDTARSDLRRAKNHAEDFAWTQIRNTIIELYDAERNVQQALHEVRNS